MPSLHCRLRRQVVCIVIERNAARAGLAVGTHRFGVPAVKSIGVSQRQIRGSSTISRMRPCVTLYAVIRRSRARRRKLLSHRTQLLGSPERIGQPNCLRRRLIRSRALFACSPPLTLRAFAGDSSLFFGLGLTPRALRSRRGVRWSSRLLLVRGRCCLGLRHTGRSTASKWHGYRKQSASHHRNPNPTPATQYRFIPIATHSSTVSCVRSRPVVAFRHEPAQIRFLHPHPSQVQRIPWPPRLQNGLKCPIWRHRPQKEKD